MWSWDSPFVLVAQGDVEGFRVQVVGQGGEHHVDLAGRGQAIVTIALPCNWKTGIDAFSETYHVQGIHRQMIPSTDDVNGPQEVWERHGRLIQPYGLASPRLRDRPDDQGVWEAFVEVMGNRVGLPTDKAAAGPAPTGISRNAAPSVPEEAHRIEFGQDTKINKRMAGNLTEK